MIKDHDSSNKDVKYTSSALGIAAAGASVGAGIGAFSTVGTSLAIAAGPLGWAALGLTALGMTIKGGFYFASKKDSD